MRIHSLDQTGVLFGADRTVCGLVTLLGIRSVVVLVGEDAQHCVETIAAGVGDRATDLLGVAGHEERIGADHHLVCIIENDGFHCSDGLSRFSRVVERDALAECQTVLLENRFDGFEYRGEVEILVSPVACLCGFVGDEVGDFVENLHELVAEIVGCHISVPF